MPTDSERHRIYLVTPVVSDAASIRDALAQALAAADVAAVLLRLSPGSERDLVGIVKALAPVVQGPGAALLLDGQPDLVGKGGADGAHVFGVAALRETATRLKPNFIVGAGGLRTRHDAMLVAEAGADYVMFGEPAADGRRPPAEAVIERVAWWAEVFEIPCVGYAANLDEVDAIARTGAEFVAVGDAVFADPRGIDVAMRDVATRLASGRSATAEAVR